tara:strand:+ start:3522 stop:3944 length:423 start_codon:yes stop_codon:yes gene_type:complete
MSKKRYTWNEVAGGDVISFTYKNKKGRRLRRTVLVLEPNLDGLIHGLQLEISNVPTNLEIHNILKIAGKVEIVDESKDIYRVKFEAANTNEPAKATYVKLKTLITKYGLYRSYSLSKATKSSVFLEDLKLPAGFIEEIKK